MAEVIRNYQSRVTEWFMALERRQRYIYIGVAVAAVLALAITIFMVTRVNYVTLTRGVSTEKAAQITNKLDELSIPWRAEDNSTTILVPEGNVDTARMQLSLSGVTTDNGFTFNDVISNMSFTQTAAEKNKMFLEYTISKTENALRTIESIEEVTLIVNIKDSSSFLNLEEELSSASLRLTLAAGKSLSEDSISGIENFVVTAIKGLTAEKITIIDQTGARLNAYRSDDAYSTSSNQDELKVNVEKRLDKTINDFLAPIYGQANVNVKTSVKLDFDREQTKLIQFSTPVEGQTTGLVRSANTLRESVVGGSGSGVPGTDSNTTETPQYPTADNGSSDYTKSQETLNYELNEIQKTIEKAQGQISDLSVAIIINSQVLENNQLSEATKDTLVKLVTAAAGVNNTQVVEVSAMPFVIEDVIPVTAASGTVFGIPIWVFAAILAVLAVLGIVAFIMMRRRSTDLQVAQEMIEEQEELEEINTEFQDRSSPKYQIEKFIDSRPEAVAQLLRSWLNED